MDKYYLFWLFQLDKRGEKVIDMYYLSWLTQVYKRDMCFFVNSSIYMTER